MGTDYANYTNEHPDREIEEDVMNVPFIAWLGTISTILIAVTVLVLTGVYYLTQRQENALRWEQADARISDLEAQRAIDEMVVDGVYELPSTGSEISQDRPKVSAPVSAGMAKVVEEFGK